MHRHSRFLSGFLPAALLVFAFAGIVNCGGSTEDPPASAPTITTQPASQTVTLGQTATFTVVATGTAPLSYQWKQDGASVGTSSASYTTPAATTADDGETFTVVVTNAAGSVTSSGALLTVDSTLAAPAIAYAPASYTFAIGTGIPAIVPTSTGGAVDSWAISPGLATGLSFDTSNGQITGTPAAALSLTTYTVTATNATGSDTATVSIRITATLAAPAIAYSPTSYTFATGTGITAIIPSNTGGTAASWGISPGLPAGLAFSTSTGQITGNPSAVSAATTYTVTATNATGNDTATLSITVNAPSTTQIIADHTIVADYSKIPAQYLTEVKKMMMYFPGESHSVAYRDGMVLLEAADAKYACNIATGEAPTDQYVRVNSGGAGEAEWFTWYAYDNHDGANKDVIKNAIKEYSDHGHPMHTIGFGWCWDLTRNSPSAAADPVLGVRWYGSTEGGPDGDKVWGLDSGDFAVTGNRVSMDTYLDATEDYRLYAISIGAPTKVIFTTGPADLDGESGYQGHLKHERMRDFVKANAARILFDYADILCYNDAGQASTTTWSSHTFPTMHSANNGDDTGHIANAGAIRLAKAQWWMLARIAGWDGK